MLINEAFPSGKFLKSEDLQGRIVKLKIASLTYEKIGTDTKLVMYFAGKEKGMVLNKTNGKTIAEAYGDETDNWIGAEINVFSMKVDFQGKLVDGLRVKIPPAPPRVPAQPQQRTEPQVPNGRDDWQNRQAPAQAPAMAEADPFDDGDSIPF